MWHSWKCWHKWISGYICIKKYTNKYPNIFLWKCLTQMNVRINIQIENCTNIHLVFTLKHTQARMSEYIHTNKFYTNKCPNIFVKENYIWMMMSDVLRDVLGPPGKHLELAKLNGQVGWSMLVTASSFNEMRVHDRRSGVVGFYNNRLSTCSLLYTLISTFTFTLTLLLTCFKCLVCLNFYLN